MAATGLTIGPQPAQAPARREFTVGGVMSARPLKDVLEDERRAAQARAEAANTAPVILSLVSQIRKHWSAAKDAKQDIERDMLAAVRARRGEYAQDVLSKLQSQGSSEIYMMLFATKARQAKALLSDVLLGSGNDKPWTIRPTPKPSLPEDLTAQLLAEASEIVYQAQESGMPMSNEDIRQLLRDAKMRAEEAVFSEARERCRRAEVQLEDMLAEGGFMDALDSFLDDLTTFKTAFIKGPVVRRKGVLKWEPQADGTSEPVAAEENKPHWERVDPFNVYPAPWARNVNDGYLIERHRLSPSALSDLIGVDGYSDDAIRQVLDAHSTGGLHEWLTVDTERAHAEGRDISSATVGTDLIDALQYWGEVPGKLLREWGMSEQEVPDEAKVYSVEAWLVGSWVIKAIINTDPLARRPYYGDSFERVPGAFWGTSLYDTVRDCEDMCNATARALANNMGISSGPQVWVNNDRLPNGQDITTMFPWKIWQTLSDPMGGTTPPMGFFQPSSNAAELMGVFEKFSALADEVSGIPRYMTGDGVAGGAGRTASGMSMMIGNAGKTVKKSLASIDMNVIAPAIRGAYEFVMRYVPDADIKGDLQIVARGAMSLVTKDTAQVRRNEFLQATANPIDMQIIGLDGRAALLREAAKTLDMNTEDIIPAASTVKLRAAQAQMQAQMQAAQGVPPEQAQQGQPPQKRQLMNGAPATDNFQPQ